MNINFRFRPKMIAAIVTLVFLNACGSSREIVSPYLISKVTIDGLIDEWNNLVYLEDSKCAVGFQNDKDYLYLCFVTAEKNDIMKIFNLGVTVWLEPEKGKIIGVKYPLRTDPSEMMMFNNPANTRVPGEFREEDISKREQTIMTNQPDLYIVNEDKFPLYAYPINDPKGFQICLGSSIGKLVYELRIPLRNNQTSPVKLETSHGEKLKVKFETGDFDRSEMGQGMRTSGTGPGGRGIPPSNGERSGSGMGNIRHEGPGDNIFNKKLEIEFEVILSIDKSH